jgi:hypothetical protein
MTDPVATNLDSHTGALAWPYAGIPALAQTKLLLRYDLHRIYVLQLPDGRSVGELL